MPRGLDRFDRPIVRIDVGGLTNRRMTDDERDELIEEIKQAVYGKKMLVAGGKAAGLVVDAWLSRHGG